MKKVVFLDRDGVINNPHGKYYIHKSEDFDINPGLVEGLQILRDRGYEFVIISNQGGIRRREYTMEDVEKVHQYLSMELSHSGIQIAATYYCPHHDTVEKCLCRKPEPLMLQKAIARFGINPGQSYFIGDKQSDIEAGVKAGVNTILINKNQDIREVLGRIG